MLSWLLIMASMKVDYKQNPALKRLSDVFHYEYFKQQAKTWPFYQRIFRRNLYWARFFISLLVFVIHQLPFLFAFTQDGVFMYYCSCLHNWRWLEWLASPGTTHQRLALKRLPHRKCMAKFWNVITPFPYFQMKRFSYMFSGLRQATNWIKFEVRTMFSWWAIKRFWGISSMRTYYSSLSINIQVINSQLYT